MHFIPVGMKKDSMRMLRNSPCLDFVHLDETIPESAMFETVSCDRANQTRDLTFVRVTRK